MDTPFRPAKVVLWYISGLMSQRLGVQIPAQVGEFLIFKNFFCQLPFGKKIQLGKMFNEGVCSSGLHSLEVVVQGGFKFRYFLFDEMQLVNIPTLYNVRQ